MLDELISQLKPIVKACSMTVLAQYPALRMYKQAHRRLSIFTDIRSSIMEHIRSYNSIESHLQRDSAEDYQLYDALSKSFRTIYRHDPSAISSLRSFTTSFQPVRASMSCLIETLDAEIDFVASCFARLDICNTIDHRPTIDSPSDLLKVWNDYISDRPLKDVYETYFYEVFPAAKDEASELLVKMTYASRHSCFKQRIFREFEQRVESQGWYCVFDTLTIRDSDMDSFLSTPTALRDYFRKVSRAVLAAEGRSVKESPSDCYSYVCVPEYGSRTGRLHFHVVHLLRTLPSGVVDPNLSNPKRNRHEINLFKGLWDWGLSSPIAVRHTGVDAYTRRGWLMPIERKGKAMVVKPLLAVARYVVKYVSKQIDQHKQLKASQCKITNLTPKTFRVRTSRGFGYGFPPLTRLSLDSLVQLTQASSELTCYPTLLRRHAKKELKNRLSSIALTHILDAQPETFNLLKELRNSMKMTGVSSLLSFTSITTVSLSVMDVSDELRDYLLTNRLGPYKPQALPQNRGGSK